MNTEDTLHKMQHELEKKIAEHANYKALFTEIADLLYICDAEGRILYVNPVFKKLSGHEPEAFIGKSFKPLFDNNDGKRAMDVYTRTLQGETPEYVLCFRDTGIVCEFKNVPWRDAKGNITGVIGTARDITGRMRAEKELKTLNESLEALVEERTRELANTNKELLEKNDLYKKAEKALQESEQKFRSVVETSGDWIWFCDTTGRITYSNPSVISILGYSDKELLGKNTLDYLHEEDRKHVGKMLPEWVRNKTGWSGLVLQWRHKNGTYRHLESRSVPVFDANGKLIGYHGIDRDITEYRHASEKIRKLSASVEQSVNIIFITDMQGRIEYVNPMFERVTGYSAAEIPGKTLRILDSGETTENVFVEMLKMVTAGKTWRGTFKNKKKDGHYYWSESLITPIRNEQGQITHTLVMQEDITEKMELKESLSVFTSYASFDGLTGLYNRTRFMELLEDWLMQAHTRTQTGAILLLDIDKFRIINDTYGSKFGDDLLKQIAECLKSIMDDIDTQYFGKTDTGIMESILCRMGGDEFAVFLSSRSEEESLAAAEEIRRRLELFQFMELSGHVTVSVGIVLYPSQGNTLYDLLKKVDAAIFSAKELGRNRSHLYQPDDLILEKMHSRVMWRDRIQKAVKEDRVETWFQPILDMNGNVIKHYEVLVRIRNEDGSIAQPGEFIDTAEAFGLIRDIDKIIIEKTLKYQEKLRKDGRRLHFSINLSAKDLEDKGFIGFLKDKLSEMQEGAARPVFEITETAAIHDLGRVVDFTKELKSLGCKLSLDDFGVGFTSFRYLKEMDVDYIKIDGSFIRKLTEGRHDRLFVKSMADVALGMGIKTVAEFVENEATMGVLRELGIDYAQGYFIGKPAPAILNG